jgi:catalase
MTRDKITIAAALLVSLGAVALAIRAVAQDITGAQERVPPNEAAAIGKVAGTIQEAVKAAYAAGQRPALRDAHAKGHGCVKATFSVVAKLPEPLRQGVFAQPKSFSAWIRFSNGSGTPQDDHKGDGRGMAIKLMGVGGPKLLPDEVNAQTQDFVMINYPVFFVRNAADYVTFTELSIAKRANEFFQKRPHEAQISAAIAALPVDHVFEQRYYSMTPYLLGNRYIKFSAIPMACLTEAPIISQATSPPAGDPNYLRADMVAWLNQKDACFYFAVQPQTDLATMPIEDPTVEWDATKAPFINVATIRIPKQTFDSPAQQTFCEDLSFTPWHALAAHRPVGGINRLRKAVYETVSKLRHQLNNAPRVEPTGNETF